MVYAIGRDTLSPNLPFKLYKYANTSGTLAYTELPNS